MEHFIKTWTHMRSNVTHEIMPVQGYRVITRGKYTFGVFLQRRDGRIIEAKYAGSGWVDDQNHSYNACDAKGNRK